MLLPKQTHPSWGDFLTPERVKQIYNIELQLHDDYNPTEKSLTLRFFELDLNAIKIVWLGQDVYPAKGVATGRAFEAGNISNWSEPFRQVSLKNIVRLIHKNYHDIDDYSKIASYSKIKTEIQAGKFPILQFKDWFNSLEEQGVLFLNTSFTCSVGVPNSHKKLWENFSEELLNFISSTNKDLIWFLWGKEAISKQSFLKCGTFYTSRHPMICSSKYEDDFLKSECFKNTWSLINWLG